MLSVTPNYHVQFPAEICNHQKYGNHIMQDTTVTQLTKGAG